MNYPRAWAHLISRGYVATDGRPMITVAHPELFRKIGYSYGGSGTVFLLPKVVDRMGNARYAIHTVRGDMVDVRLVNDELEGKTDGLAALSQGLPGIDVGKVLEDLARSLENAKEDLRRSHASIGEALAMLKGLRNEEGSDE